MIHAFAPMFAKLRSALVLPGMDAPQLAQFRESQSRYRQPLVVPTLLVAVLMNCAFLAWDLLLAPAGLGPAALCRLLGAAVMVALLVLLRYVLKLSLRAQALTLYCAFYAWNLVIGIALGTESDHQLPGLLIIMFCSILALPRASDARINIPLAAASVPLVLPHSGAANPALADLVYVGGHFGVVVFLVFVACALVEGLAARNFLYHQRLRHEASTDALTGLYNRRVFEAGIQREIGNAERLGLPLSLAIIDLDHFKAVNDRFGHAVGDALLRAVAAALQIESRQGHLLVRLGGEEFGLLMLGSSPAAAAVALERSRAQVAALRVPAGEAVAACTISVGVAEWRAGETGWAGLYQRADRALYAAKAAGRDRIMLAPSAGDQLASACISA